MADKKEIRRLEIEPAETGGHTITHYFKDRPRNDTKNGMHMEYQEPEKHVFGTDEDEKMLGHVATHLGLKTGNGKVADKDEDGE
jgi:hypothetical protein